MTSASRFHAIPLAWVLLVGVASSGCAATTEPRDAAVVHLREAPAPSALPSTEPEPEPQLEPDAWKPKHQAVPTPDDPPAHDDGADRERARELFQQGAELYQQGDYAKARDAFQAAYDLVPEQALLFNIATAELRLNDMIHACDHLRQYVNQGDPTDPRIVTVRAQVARRCSAMP